MYKKKYLKRKKIIKICPLGENIANVVWDSSFMNKWFKDTLHLNKIKVTSREKANWNFGKRPSLPSSQHKYNRAYWMPVIARFTSIRHLKLYSPFQFYLILNFFPSLSIKIGIYFYFFVCSSGFTTIWLNTRNCIVILPSNRIVNCP